jgi:hypothetical protein
MYSPTRVPIVLLEQPIARADNGFINFGFWIADFGLRELA